MKRSPSAIDADIDVDIDAKPSFDDFIDRLDAYDPAADDSGSEYAASPSPSPFASPRKKARATPAKSPRTPKTKNQITSTKTKSEARDAADDDDSGSGSGSGPGSGSHSKPPTKKRTPGKKGAGTPVLGTTGMSPKARYALMIFEQGIAALDKGSVTSSTGLSPGQQNDMIRRDKGSLRKAFEGFVEGL